MSSSQPSLPSFRDLSLAEPVLQALNDIGYETPTPIQAETIPHLLKGNDLLGQAQTGTGKTAAFALPLLTRINPREASPQVLVLAPTRELAIQVAEAFQRYARYMPGIHVLPVYGGQDYRTQLRPLKRGVHIVVGTPGRVMDHMRRKSLQLDKLSCLVLDEADEMLRMGFIDDVEWVLEQTPDTRQIALFSATMPKEVKRIAKRHLHDPTEITVKVKSATADTIHQRMWMVSGVHKLDALTRILEVEPFDGMIVFVRTKTATLQLAEKLEARGFASAALNGDIPQNQRERTVGQLKKGTLDILVATDVAARGLDVERISHVVNYDIPHDTESYIHRIGRTGRAGRKGEAILFVAPRERRMLRNIEQATRKTIEKMRLPSTNDINDRRIARFKQRISDVVASNESNDFYQKLLEQYQEEHNVPAIEIAAALAKLLQGNEPLLIKDQPHRKQADNTGQEFTHTRNNKKPQRRKEAEEGMQRYRLAVGHDHGVKPGNIVGAIANEAGLESQYIGQIQIFGAYSTIDLPEGMPKEIFYDLKKTWVCGQQLQIEQEGQEYTKPAKHKKKNKGKLTRKKKAAKQKTRRKNNSQHTPTKD